MPRLTALLKEWGINATETVVVDLSGRTSGRNGASGCATLSRHTPSRRTSASSRCSRWCARSRRPQTRRRVARDSRSSRQRRAAGRRRTSHRWRTRRSSARRTGEGRRRRSGLDRRGHRGPGRHAREAGRHARVEPAGRRADEAPKPETRVAAIGDSDFAANAYLGIEGNRDLFMNTVNWLAQQENLIAIRPREAADRRITLTANTDHRHVLDHDRRDSGDRPRRRRLHLVAEALAMRGVWSTLALVVVLGGLVGYIYFVDSKQRAGRHRPSRRSRSPRCRPTTSRKCRSRAPTARRRASRRPTASGSSSSRSRLLPTRAR